MLVGAGRLGISISETNLVTLAAVDIIMTGVQLPLMYHGRRQVVYVPRFVDVGVGVRRVWKHVDRQGEVNSAF